MVIGRAKLSAPPEPSNWKALPSLPEIVRLAAEPSALEFVIRVIPPLATMAPDMLLVAFVRMSVPGSLFWKPFAPVNCELMVNVLPRVTPIMLLEFVALLNTNERLVLNVPNASNVLGAPLRVIVLPESPRAVSEAAPRTPPVMVMLPVKSFVASDSTSVPAPAFVKPVVEPVTFPPSTSPCTTPGAVDVPVFTVKLAAPLRVVWPFTRNP